jgi:hypothetical protein
MQRQSEASSLHMIENTTASNEELSIEILCKAKGMHGEFKLTTV